MALAMNSSVSIGATPFLTRNSLSSSRLAFISLAKRTCQGGSPSESMLNVSRQEKEGAGEGIVGPWGVEQRAFGLRVKRGQPRPLSTRAGLEVAAVASSLSIASRHRAIPPAWLQGSRRIALSLKNRRPDSRRTAEQKTPSLWMWRGATLTGFL